MEVTKLFPRASIDTIVYMADLKKHIEPEPKKFDQKPSLREILTEVCKIFEVDPEKIRQHHKKKTLAIPRMIFSYVACMVTDNTLYDIGDFLDGRHHTTVMHHRETARSFIRNNDYEFMQYWNHYRNETKIFPKTK